MSFSTIIKKLPVYRRVAYLYGFISIIIAAFSYFFYYTTEKDFIENIVHPYVLPVLIIGIFFFITGFNIKQNIIFKIIQLIIFLVISIFTILSEPDSTFALTTIIVILLLGYCYRFLKNRFFLKATLTVLYVFGGTYLSCLINQISKPFIISITATLNYTSVLCVIFILFYEEIEKYRVRLETDRIKTLIGELRTSILQGESKEKQIQILDKLDHSANASENLLNRILKIEATLE